MRPIFWMARIYLVNDPLAIKIMTQCFVVVSYIMRLPCTLASISLPGAG